MSRLADFVQSIREEPFVVIEMLWGIGLVANGIYLLLPSYVPTTGSVLIQFASSPFVSLGIAVLYIVTGLAALAAAYFGRMRHVSTFMLFLAFFFTVLIRLLTVGFVPTVWVWPTLLALTAAVDYWRVKWKPSSP